MNTNQRKLRRERMKISNDPLKMRTERAGLRPADSRRRLSPHKSMRDGSGDGDLRRGAGGLGCEELCGRCFCGRFGDLFFDGRSRDRRERRPRMGKLGCCYGTAVALVAATGAAESAFIRVGAVALVDCFPETAGVRRRSCDR